MRPKFQGAISTDALRKLKVKGKKQNNRQLGRHITDLFVFTTNKMVNDMRTASGTSAITKPLLASITQNYTRWIMDVTVAASVLWQLLWASLGYAVCAHSETIKGFEIKSILFRVIQGNKRA